MSYENAPATRLVATHCAVCNRPLVDAQSVETGIGPECRKKHGYDATVAPEARTEANRLVYEIAARQDGLEVAKAAERLRQLGFDRLAHRILERVAVIMIVEGRDYDDGRGRRRDVLLVSVPYVEAALPAWRGLRAYWRKDEKRYEISVSRRADLWALLRVYYPGQIGFGPRGPFVVA